VLAQQRPQSIARHLGNRPGWQKQLSGYLRRTTNQALYQAPLTWRYCLTDASDVAIATKGPAVSLLADQQLDQAQKSLEQIVHRIHNNGEVSIAANRIY
jgi:hypothetical protein